MPFNPNLMGRQYAPANSAQPRNRNTLLWLIPIIGVALLGILVYSMSGRNNAGDTSSSNRTRSESIPSGGSVTPSPSPSVATATPTPRITTSPTISGNTDSQRVTQQSSNTFPGSQDDQAQAEEKIRSILRRNAGGCQINKVLSVSAERTAYGWKVMARVVMSASGSPLTETAIWNVTEKNGVVAASQLSAEIEHGCD